VRRLEPWHERTWSIIRGDQAVCLCRVYACDLHSSCLVVKLPQDGCPKQAKLQRGLLLQRLTDTDSTQEMPTARAVTKVYANAVLS
jgi:hypothetical protein